MPACARPRRRPPLLASLPPPLQMDLALRLHTRLHGARRRPSAAAVPPAAAAAVMRTVPLHVAGDGHRARGDAVRVRRCARRARRAPRVAGAVLLSSLCRCCRRAHSRADFPPGWQRRALLALRHYGPQRSPRRSTAHSDSRVSMITMHSGASLLLLCRPLQRGFTRGQSDTDWRCVQIPTLPMKGSSARRCTSTMRCRGGAAALTGQWPRRRACVHSRCGTQQHDGPPQEHVRPQQRKHAATSPRPPPQQQVLRGLRLVRAANLVVYMSLGFIERPIW